MSGMRRCKWPLTIAALVLAVGFAGNAAWGASGGGHAGGGGGGGFSGGGGGGRSGGFNAATGSGGSRSVGGMSGASGSHFSSGSASNFSSSRGIDSRSFAPQSHGVFSNSDGRSSSAHVGSQFDRGSRGIDSMSHSLGSFDRLSSHGESWNRSVSSWRQGEHDGHGDRDWHGDHDHGDHDHNDWGDHHHSYWPYYPRLLLSGTYWFPSWDYYNYYPVNNGLAPYQYGSPYFAYYQTQPTESQPEVAQNQYGGPQPKDASPDGAEFYAQAESAFRGGQYRDAMRLASHAAIESPKNPKAHELMSLSLFAAGDYRGAAIEAHAALALGPAATWDTLYNYYGNDETYTGQLRTLEKYSHDNPKAAEARFLRAYHYLMTGHQSAAMEELTMAVEQTPTDKLAAALLKNNGQLPADGPANDSAPLPPPPNNSDAIKPQVVKPEAAKPGAGKSDNNSPPSSGGAEKSTTADDGSVET